MASAEELAELRRYVAEEDETVFTDLYLGTLIDSFGILGAAYRVWDQKAASAAELVNTSEAGASHAFSDLHKNALSMAEYFRALEVEEAAAAVPTTGRTRVRKIERT